MYERRLLIFQSWNRLPLIYPTIYHLIIWSILFMIRRKHFCKLLDFTLAFTTGHVWRPFSVYSWLQCVCREGGCVKHFPWQCRMWHVFWSTLQCRRESGIILWNNSLLKPDDANAGLKNLWWWRHVCRCRWPPTWAFKTLKTFSDHT